MENTIGEMLLITVSYELLPITPSLLNHVQFNWKKNGQMRGSFYGQKRDVCFLILQKYFRTSSFDRFFFLNLRYGAAAGVTQLFICSAFKSGPGMELLILN